MDTNGNENNVGVMYMGERQEGEKVKVKFTLEQATKAQKGSRGIAVLFV